MQTDTILDPPRDRTAPDMSGYRAGHDVMRASNQLLVDGIANTEPGDRRRIRAVRRWFSGYAGELRAHHRSEDEIFFPALARHVPSFDEYAALAGDHAALHDLIERLEAVLLVWSEEPGSEILTARALALAVALSDLLATHLDFEDADILPLFERHMTAEEYAELNQQMLKQLELKQAMFTVPWILDGLDPARRAAMWDMGTMPLKIVYFLSRRRYRRLVARAFGSAS